MGLAAMAEIATQISNSQAATVEEDAEKTLENAEEDLEAAEYLYQYI